MVFCEMLNERLFSTCAIGRARLGRSPRPLRQTPPAVLSGGDGAWSAYCIGRFLMLPLAVVMAWTTVCGNASGEATMRLEPVPPQGVWLEVVAEAYTARIHGCGEIEVWVAGKKKFTGSLIERWKFYQNREFVRFPRAATRLPPGNLSADVAFSYFWNGGQVEERLTFTSHSIAINCEYRPERDRDISTFTYFLSCPFDGGPGPDLVGGIYRFDKQDAVEELGRWQEFKPRLSSVSLRNAGQLQLDFLAEGSAWFFLWKDKNNGFIGLGDNGPRWNYASRKAGEVFCLGLLVWLSNADGTNLPDTTLKIESPVDNHNSSNRNDR